MKKNQPQNNKSKRQKLDKQQANGCCCGSVFLQDMLVDMSKPTLAGSHAAILASEVFSYLEPHDVFHGLALLNTTFHGAIQKITTMTPTQEPVVASPTKNHQKKQSSGSTHYHYATYSLPYWKDLQIFLRLGCERTLLTKIAHALRSRSFRMLGRGEFFDDAMDWNNMMNANTTMTTATLRDVFLCEAIQSFLFVRHEDGPWTSVLAEEASHGAALTGDYFALGNPTSIGTCTMCHVASKEEEKDRILDNNTTERARAGDENRSGPVFFHLSDGKVNNVLCGDCFTKEPSLFLPFCQEHKMGTTDGASSAPSFDLVAVYALSDCRHEALFSNATNPRPDDWNEPSFMRLQEGEFAVRLYKHDHFWLGQHCLYFIGKTDSS